jgi:glycosyltransferase 2 family protein
LTEPPPLAPPPDHRSRRNLLRAAVLLCLFAFATVALARSWPEARPALARLSVASIGLAMLTVLAGLFTSFLGWRSVLAEYGGRLPLAGGLRVFFLGQLGKYLPGSVWPAVAQMELGREYKVPRRVSAATAAIFMLLILGTGLLVAAMSLPLLGSVAVHRYWWILAVLPVAVAVLYPPVLNRLVALALGLLRREPMPSPLSVVGVAKAAGWSLATWGLWGVHVWILAIGVGAGGPSLIWRATGSFAAAWSLGFLLLPVPAGAVVREAALIVLLRPGMTAGQATVVALASRLLLTIGDLGWGLVALLAERRRRLGGEGPPPIRRAPDRLPGEE